MNFRVLNGGIHEEDVFFGYNKIKLLHLSNLKWANIYLFDIILIPFHLDQIYLREKNNLLNKFLKMGGILIVLGATEESRKWLPRGTWEKEYTSDIIVDENKSDSKIIFKNIDHKNMGCQYHSSYVAHGSISVNEDDKIDILAEDSNNRITMLVYRNRKNGILLETTLDPDYHSLVHVPGPSNETSEETHKKALTLLNNIIDWSILQYKEKGLLNRIWKKTVGYSLLFLISLAKLALLLSPFAVLALLFNSQFQQYFLKELNFITVGFNILAIVGSIASIFSVAYTIRQNRR